MSSADGIGDRGSGAVVVVGAVVGVGGGGGGTDGEGEATPPPPGSVTTAAVVVGAVVAGTVVVVVVGMVSHDAGLTSVVPSVGVGAAGANSTTAAATMNAAARAVRFAAVG